MVCLKPGGSAPEGCPVRSHPDVLRKARKRYSESAVKAFAHNALLQHNEAVLHLPEGGMVPRNPRIEEIAQFAKKMGYTKLGIAFCSALKKEADVAQTILANRGFSVVSVCCSVGGLPAETVGVTGAGKLGGAQAHQIMCNPIAPVSYTHLTLPTN